ncbi:MAG: YdjY domain-containing protein [Planctomycetota bacterium]
MKALGAILMVAMLAGCRAAGPETAGSPALPGRGEVVIDRSRGEVVIQAVVQHPVGKPCIDDWGQRVQAFVGCRFAAGGAARFADYFVFLSDASTEKVHDALVELGAKPRPYGSNPEGEKGAASTGEGGGDFLRGAPVQLSVFWKEGDAWKEKPYQDFVREKVIADGAEIIKPWTPHFVFHGSGAAQSSGTGCIACPCDCPKGIIADNRRAISDPKPIVRFDWSQAPPVGTIVYVRLRPSPAKGM